MPTATITAPDGAHIDVPFTGAQPDPNLLSAAVDHYMSSKGQANAAPPPAITPPPAVTPATAPVASPSLPASPVTTSAQSPAPVAPLIPTLSPPQAQDAQKQQAYHEQRAGVDAAIAQYKAKPAASINDYANMQRVLNEYAGWVEANGYKGDSGYQTFLNANAAHGFPVTPKAAGAGNWFTNTVVPNAQSVVKGTADSIARLGGDMFGGTVGVDPTGQTSYQAAQAGQDPGTRDFPQAAQAFNPANIVNAPGVKPILGMAGAALEGMDTESHADAQNPGADFHRGALALKSDAVHRPVETLLNLYPFLHEPLMAHAGMGIDAVRGIRETGARAATAPPVSGPTPSDIVARQSRFTAPLKPLYAGAATDPRVQRGAQQFAAREPIPAEATPSPNFTPRPVETASAPSVVDDVVRKSLDRMKQRRGATEQPEPIPAPAVHAPDSGVPTPTIGTVPGIGRPGVNGVPPIAAPGMSSLPTERVPGPAPFTPPGANATAPVEVPAAPPSTDTLVLFKQAMEATRHRLAQEPLTENERKDAQSAVQSVHAGDATPDDIREHLGRALHSLQLWLSNHPAPEHWTDTAKTSIGELSSHVKSLNAAIDATTGGKDFAPPRVTAEKQFAADAGVQFTPRPNDAKPAPVKGGKVSAKTGMTKEQEAYLSNALTDYAHTEGAHDEMSHDGKWGKTFTPAVIDVPGDGRYTVTGVSQASQLHLNLTGKPLMLTHKIGGTESLPHPLDLSVHFKQEPMPPRMDGHSQLTPGGFLPRKGPNGEPFQGVPDMTVPAAKRPGVLAQYATDEPFPEGKPQAIPQPAAHSQEVNGILTPEETEPLNREYAALKTKTHPSPADARRMGELQSLAEQHNKARLQQQSHDLLQKTRADKSAMKAAGWEPGNPEYDKSDTPLSDWFDKHAQDAPAATPAPSLSGKLETVAPKSPLLDPNALSSFGVGALSPMAEKAANIIGSHLVSAAGATRDLAMNLAANTTGGRFRHSYAFDKATGDQLNKTAASRESGLSYAELMSRYVHDGLSPEQRDLLGRYYADQRYQGLTALGKTRLTVPELTPAERQQIANDPAIQGAIQKYENQPGAYLYNARKFVSPRMKKSPTPSGHFASLIPKDTPSPAGGVGAGSLASMQRMKGTRFANQATGTAKQGYETDMGTVLRHAVPEIVHKANTRQLYKTILAAKDSAGNPLGVTNVGGKPLPQTMMWEGKEYPTRRIEVANRAIPGPKLANGTIGKPRLLKVEMAVPEPVGIDVADVTTNIPKADNLIKAAQKIGSVSTAIQLTGPAEIIFHANRVLSLAKAIPGMTSGVPLLGRAQTLGKLINLDMSHPDNMAALQRLMEANAGSSRPFSHAGGDVNAISRFNHGTLFGLPEGKGLKQLTGGNFGLDLRLRVAAENIRAKLEGNTDPQRVRDFANQFGQYTSYPNHEVEIARYVHPFAASSLPMRITEVRQLTGGTGMKGLSPAVAAKVRAQSLAAGVGGTALGFIMLNHLASGHWPWQNAPGHEFDLEAGKDKDGKPVYVPGTAIAPTISRPLHMAGIPDMVTNARTPQTPAKRADETAMAVSRGAGNAALQELNSPLAGTVLAGLKGRAAYFTKGGDLLRIAPTAKAGQSQAALNAASAAAGLLPFGRAAGEVPAFSGDIKHMGGTFDNPALAGLAAAGLLRKDAPPTHRSSGGRGERGGRSQTRRER